MLFTAVANINITCAFNKYLNFSPTFSICIDYIAFYIKLTGGYFKNPSTITNCSYYFIGDTNVFLANISSNYSKA